MLKGRYKPKQTNLPVILLYYDQDSLVTLFSDGSFRYHGSDLEFKDLLEDNIGIPSHLAICFCGNRYVVDRGGFNCWKNIPSEMQELIDSKSDVSITWTAFGYRENSFFISFSDGRKFWNNVPKKLDEILKSSKKDIKRVCLSQFDERYLIFYEDGNLECY